LAKYDVAVLYPRDPSQDKVLSAIRAIKAGNFTDESRDQLQRVSDELVTRGAEVILIACTELSVVAKKLQLPVVTYDSAQVLAEAIVAEAMSAQLNCCERFCAKGVDVINR
jgi:aspartate racemase